VRDHAEALVAVPHTRRRRQQVLGIEIQIGLGVRSDFAGFGQEEGHVREERYEPGIEWTSDPSVPETTGPRSSHRSPGQSTEVGHCSRGGKYPDDVRRVAVSVGGIGSGKTAATDFLGSRGCDVVDADVIARAVVSAWRASVVNSSTFIRGIG
jgi:hypothetical protein